ncbi:uncharacterized protein JCM6883_000818 [Sporobolomyces salmoneus]|uniref:uncharacterized protein n=1 Tax=Sporobolomyces salmoneus TaxID=183962 RepID=UPI0031707C72
MFTTFSQGSDDPSNWNDQPNYRPGRFHAHVLASSASPSPVPSTSSTGGELSSVGPGKSPTKRERLKNVGGGAKRFFQRQRQKRGQQDQIDEGGGRERTRERERLLDDSFNVPRPSLNAASTAGGRLFIDGPLPRRTQPKRSIPEEEENEEEEGDDDEEDEINWVLLRPGKKRVKRWMKSWWKRWALLVMLPCCIVWAWCSIPFPVSDPYQEEPPWHIPWPPSTSDPPGTFEVLLRKLPWIEDQRVQPEEKKTEFAVLDSSMNTTQEDLDLELFGSSHPTVHQMWSPEEEKPLEEVPTEGDEDLPVDANFYFFLIVYYGVYLAVALVFVTKLFDLYRLNWWPSSLGGAFWYSLFWTSSLFLGFLLHKFDLDGFGRRSHHSDGGGRHHKGGGGGGGRRGGDDSDPTNNPDSWDWERKTTWVLLAFATMAMPALACFGKLRADRRNSWRRSLTPAQKTFLERQLTQRMPRSYRRFLWFLTAIALSLLTLIMGQGFATIYLSTLPHSNFEGLVYVWTLILSINLLNNVSNWILQRKVRSQSLVFIFRLLFQLTYHVFYRNLFARLRSPDQAAYITLLSSSFVILWYPLSMSKTFHRLLRWTVGTSMEWPEYSHSVATMFYLRNLSENVTMVAFLGWVTILHWGPNQLIYPFFSFADPSDPYTYRLTISASLVIWIAELFSSWMARGVCWLAYGIDVTSVGLDQLRTHPDLVVACICASTHVLMDILLFLVKLNFR